MKIRDTESIKLQLNQKFIEFLSDLIRSLYVINFSQFTIILIERLQSSKTRDVSIFDLQTLDRTFGSLNIQTFRFLNLRLFISFSLVRTLNIYIFDQISSKILNAEISFQPNSRISRRSIFWDFQI